MGTVLHKGVIWKGKLCLRHWKHKTCNCLPGVAYCMRLNYYVNQQMKSLREPTDEISFKLSLYFLGVTKKMDRPNFQKGNASVGLGDVLAGVVLAPQRAGREPPTPVGKT